ncbi:MAG: hypothetical protein ABW101_15955 [Candidatus Thiodiazotropha sp.]
MEMPEISDQPNPQPESSVETEWSPANPNNGQTYQNRRIRRASTTRWEVVPTLKSMMIYLYLTIFGAVIAIATLLSGTSLLPSLFGLVVAIAGLLLIYGETTPVVIDKASGLLYREPRLPLFPGHRENRPVSYPLKDFHAVQVLKEKECLCAGESTHPYYSYELNLVFLDGSRFNLMDHADLRKLNNDARLLARFLDLPLWERDTSTNGEP